MAAAGKLRFPVLGVNEALTKHLFDNRYGTGQSAIDGILRATNVLLRRQERGRRWLRLGRPRIASRAHGMGANVSVVEVDPIRALEAAMDGYRVMNADAAAEIGDIFIAATGNLNVWGARHFPKMRDGVLGQCRALQRRVRARCAGGAGNLVPRGAAVHARIPDARWAAPLPPGRRAARQPGRRRGPPRLVMDMSFANQALGLEWLREPRRRARAARCTAFPTRSIGRSRASSC